MRRTLGDDARRFSSPLAVPQIDRLKESLDGQDARPVSLPPRSRSISERAHRRDQSVRFRDELQMSQASTPAQSEDEESLAGSDHTTATDGSARRKRRQRAPRKSTHFALAQPAPVLRTKQRKLVQFRPRLLLQLQELGERRAIPAFDVIPSSHIAGTFIIPALTKRFPRLFGAKPDLGHDDLLLVRSEDFRSSTGSPIDADDSEDGLDRRDVIAIVSAKPREGDDHADIILSDGSTWAAHGIANGSYEVTKLEGGSQPTTGRWVRKTGTAHSRRGSIVSMELPKSNSSLSPDQKWTFSIMERSARRHPVMGILTSNGLEVYDTYNTLSASSGRYPPTRSFVPDATGDDQLSTLSSGREERTTLQVSDELKSLMMASAIWIALRQQGWPSIANPRCSKAVSHYRNSLAEYPRRSSTFPSSQTDSSMDMKRSGGEQGQVYGGGSGSGTGSPASSQTALPKRSVSAASHFLRRKKKLETSPATSHEGSPVGQKVLELPTHPKRPMSKMVQWFRHCFGDGGAGRNKNRPALTQHV